MGFQLETQRMAMSIFDPSTTMSIVVKICVTFLAAVVTTLCVSLLSVTQSMHVDTTLVKPRTRIQEVQLNCQRFNCYSCSCQIIVYAIV